MPIHAGSVADRGTGRVGGGGAGHCLALKGAGMSRHLAQVNIGRVLGGLDDPRMADFYNNLAVINAMAERMPGFVWRLKDESGESAMALHWPGDPTMNVNMSVWESAESLG